MNIQTNNMIRCKNCGRLIPSESSSCRYCGDELTNTSESSISASERNSTAKKRKKIAKFIVLGIFALFTIISVINTTDFKFSKLVKTEQTLAEKTEPEFENSSITVREIDNPVVRNAPNKMRVKIIRITLTDEYTAVACTVDNTQGAYSYITIDPETYITLNESDMAAEKMSWTVGIGVSPQKTEVPKGKVAYFTLYFPPIDRDTRVLDLEESGENGWKFYGIQLK
ncbi:MAG: hypothetical protein II956_06430 [Bacteroidales bacterium]|nr:hypothetical protein [Bacteroidales bacterium]